MTTKLMKYIFGDLQLKAVCQVEFVSYRYNISTLSFWRSNWILL